jgi:ADP-ribose pyrophosphatase YjhB (NUDIX family)
MNPKTLPAALWRTIQASVPILCVDVLPLRRVETGQREVGLIRRDTPHQGERWCLIGGRVGLNEPIAQAVDREVREALGEAARCEWTPTSQPHRIVEYFSDGRPGALLDPRQHALSLTFWVEISGPLTLGGEARDFQWFETRGLPDPAEFGFGQDQVVADCIEQLGLR